MSAEHAEAIAQAWAEVCRDERVETAARILHNRRHLLGTANTCERCTGDARAVAVVFAAPAVPDIAEPPTALTGATCEWCDSLVPVRSDGRFMGHPGRLGGNCPGTRRLAVDPPAARSLSTEETRTDA